MHEFGLEWMLEISGTLVELLCLGVFGLIFRITKDIAYLLLAIGSILNLIVAALYYLAYDLDLYIGIMLAPLVELGANVLWLSGLLLLGIRASKWFRCPSEKPPPLPLS